MGSVVLYWGPITGGFIQHLKIINNTYYWVGGWLGIGFFYDGDPSLGVYSAPGNNKIYVLMGG